MVKKEKKGFVWKSLRISFWIMVTNLVIGSLFSQNEYWIVFMEDIMALILSCTVIFTFVVSIIHLVKHKKKAFAITSLVISSIFLLLVFLGMFMVIVENYNNDDIDVEEYVDISCHNFCIGIENVDSYYYEYDDAKNEIICYCLDSDEEILIQKPIILE